MTISATDLGTYLGVTLDTDEQARATQLIAWATTLCESIVNPLPAGSDPVVLDVVARGFTNPTNVQQQTSGPFSVNHGAVRGGLWLTRENKRTLRRLAGGGGAFSIDTTPAGAGTGLPIWDTGDVIDTGWPVYEI